MYVDLNRAELIATKPRRFSAEERAWAERVLGRKIELGPELAPKPNPNGALLPPPPPPVADEGDRPTRAFDLSEIAAATAAVAADAEPETKKKAPAPKKSEPRRAAAKKPKP